MPTLELGCIEKNILECWNIGTGEGLGSNALVSHAIRPILSTLSSKHATQILSCKSNMKVEDSVPGSNLRPSLLPATFMHPLLFAVLPRPTPFLQTLEPRRSLQSWQWHFFSKGRAAKCKERHLTCSGQRGGSHDELGGHGRTGGRIFTQWQMSGHKGHFWSVSQGLRKSEQPQLVCGPTRVPVFLSLS